MAAQNRTKTQADKNRSDREFQEGDQVLLKLQPYAPCSVVNRPCLKLSLKYFGPYKVLQRVGNAAYRLQLPDSAQVHPTFHVSQLKPYTPNCTHVFFKLPKLVDLEHESLKPEKMLQRRLVKKGNTAIPQWLVKWTHLPEDLQHGKRPCLPAFSICTCLGPGRFCRGCCHGWSTTKEGGALAVTEKHKRSSACVVL